MTDYERRLEALRLAVQFASAPGTTATTERVVNSAKSFDKFLKGDA